MTTTQIETLRREALTAGDDKQLIICDLALRTAHRDCCGGGATGAAGCTATLKDVYAAVRLSAREWRELESMDAYEALAECERVVADAEAAKS